MHASSRTFHSIKSISGKNVFKKSLKELWWPPRASTLILLPGKEKIREYVNSENAPIGFVNKVSRYSQLVLFTSTEHYFSKLSESVTYTRLLCPSCHLNLNLNLNLNQQIWNPVALRLRPIPASFNCILSANNPWSELFFTYLLLSVIPLAVGLSTTCPLVPSILPFPFCPFWFSLGRCVSGYYKFLNSMRYQEFNTASGYPATSRSVIIHVI
jgi:hypothetical protein